MKASGEPRILDTRVQKVYLIGENPMESTIFKKNREGVWERCSAHPPRCTCDVPPDSVRSCQPLGEEMGDLDYLTLHHHSILCNIHRSALFNKNNVSEIGDTIEDEKWVEMVINYDVDEVDEDEVTDRAFLENFHRRFNSIITADDRHGFIELMKSIDVRAYREVDIYHRSRRRTVAAYKHNSCPLVFFESICAYGAINCAKALLEGESGLILDLELDPEMGDSPMHLAATAMSCDVINLLLRYGDRTDVRSKETSVGKGGLLPLNVALEKLRSHESLYDWSPKDSALQLIMKLCLPNVKIPLEVNRLLALNTKHVDDIFYYYAMEGKLIEVAALLMVAREKVMGGFGGNMDIIISQHLAEEIASIVLDEIRCGLRGVCAPAFKDNRLVFASALELLEIFETAGDSIGAYVQSVQSDMCQREAVKGMIVLLEGYGFSLKNEDTILRNIDCDCRECGEKLETRLSEKRKADGSQNLGESLLSRVRSGHSNARKDPDPNILFERNKAKEALLPSRFFRPGVPSPLFKSWNEWGRVRQWKTIEQKSLQELLSAKTYGRFGLLIKRGIRHII